MKRIENGFQDYYFLLENGELYNSKTDRTIKADNKHSFMLKTMDNKYKRVTLKELYKKVYSKNFCEDDIEDLEGEEWRFIDDTDENYLVSNKGRVKSRCNYKARILKASIANNGYERVDIIYNEKQRQSKLVHRLVAAAFLIQPKSFDEQLHHKDFDKRNNAANNLEWLKPTEHKKKHTERKGEVENGTVSNSTKSKNN